MGVRSIEAVSPAMLSAQIEAVLEDFDIKAIKIGMIYNSENVMAIKKSLLKCNYQGPIVLDPVLVATSGDPLSSDNLVNAMKTELFPMATIVTPNIPEAEVLSGMEVKSIDDMRHAAKKIIADTGVENVLVKGGHGSSGLERLFLNDRIDTRNTHGTGCTLSSAIASYMTSIKSLRKAVKHAVKYVHWAILSAKNLDTGHGHGSLNHLSRPIRLATTEIIHTDDSSN